MYLPDFLPKLTSTISHYSLSTFTQFLSITSKSLSTAIQNFLTNPYWHRLDFIPGLPDTFAAVPPAPPKSWPNVHNESRRNSWARSAAAPAPLSKRGPRLHQMPVAAVIRRWIRHISQKFKFCEIQEFAIFAQVNHGSTLDAGAKRQKTTFKCESAADSTTNGSKRHLFGRCCAQQWLTPRKQMSVGFSKIFYGLFCCIRFEVFETELDLVEILWTSKK
jgi:hypothetical protein